jgi:hypothetical protein
MENAVTAGMILMIPLVGVFVGLAILGYGFYRQAKLN